MTVGNRVIGKGGAADARIETFRRLHEQRQAANRAAEKAVASAQQSPLRPGPQVRYVSTEPQPAPGPPPRIRRS
jgi:hypothetical protein